MKKLLLLTTVLMIAAALNAQIIHVPANQPTIQAGINASNPGDTVLVANGTYLENINFNGKSITVASHFILDADTNHINNTIIDGSQPANPDYGSVVTFITGEDTTSVICGFTITGGTGMIEPVYGDRTGGGIACYIASPKIAHNKIIGNQVSSDLGASGGGIDCFNYGNSHWIVVEHNLISGNQCTSGSSFAVAGGLSLSGNAKIFNNIIANNQCTNTTGNAYGGGLFYQSFNIPADTLLLIGNNIDYNAVAATNMTTNIYSAGGGAYITLADLTAFGNSFNHNTISGYTINGVGLIINFIASAKVTGNVISMNNAISPYSWWGVGCQCASAQGPVVFSGNEFSFNTGPNEGYGVGTGLNVTNAYWNKIKISGNIFRENINQWFGGGLYSWNCYDLIVQNNIFDGNLSRSGGAVGINIPASGDLWRPVFINNTFVNNSASFRGGAIHLNCESNLPVIINSVFHNNSSPTANNISFVGSTDPFYLSYCDIDTAQISGPWTGIGSINEDPQFCAGDIMCHLTAGSPCINTGVNQLEIDGVTYYSPSYDFDGELRPDPVSFAVDMGADEFWGMPDPPIALHPNTIGPDFFEARWDSSVLAMGYYLDVAFDASFSNMVPGYTNLDVGNNNSYSVESLQPVDYYYRVRAYNTMFTSEHSNVIAVLTVGIPQLEIGNRKSEITIYPNPFTHQITIEFELTTKSLVTLQVFNHLGQLIDEMANETMEAGTHRINRGTIGLPAGVYYCRLIAGKQTYSGKIFKNH